MAGKKTTTTPKGKKTPGKDDDTELRRLRKLTKDLEAENERLRAELKSQEKARGRLEREAAEARGRKLRDNVAVVDGVEYEIITRIKTVSELEDDRKKRFVEEDRAAVCLDKIGA